MKNYDEQIKQYGWKGAEVIFDLSKEYVKAGERLIDLGIGTGLSSKLFHESGLAVWGCDNSEIMLDACRAKGFASGLKQHDIEKFPYPYDSGFFNHAVSIGVLHLLEDISATIAEVARLIKPDGIFAFSIMDREDSENSELILKLNHKIYRHNFKQINDNLKRYDFGIVKSQELNMPINKKGDGIPAMAYVAKKNAG